MAVTAQQVKILRERTGAGMMECKKALVAADGDVDAAAEQMRKSGLARADKKAGRVAAEGVIVIRMSDDGATAAIAEVNCETDFVANGEAFRGFADGVAEAALGARTADLDALLNRSVAGETIEERRRSLVATLGENIRVRRFDRLTSQGSLGHYLHGSRIGVIVALEGGDEALARDLAMHVAASSPAYITAEEVPAEMLAKEREILREQAATEGKPPAIVEKMVEGRLGKYLGAITLLGQPFVKDDQILVAKLVEQRGARVTGFRRYEVGEGIEKPEDDFVAEVMKQVRGASG
ncbi:MAG: elongation factor Ts [Gammaproteobacteria bacterium]|nr:elongation factor Ts [Gammaproteobacteria bacterium]